MTTFNGNFTRSISGSSPEDSSVTFGVDVDQAPVYLNVDVIPSYAFARLMLVLGKVVRMQDAGIEKDHSAYQEWVRGEYLKELNDEIKEKKAKLPGLLEKKNKITKLLKSIKEKGEKYDSKNFIKERNKFWQWLYTHNREAWYVLDPIVSVQPDATFFEAFSLDESTYSRVSLPHSATSSNKKPSCGTTNIDFSVSLERELARTRKYRPLHLTVGSDSVGVDTGVSSTVEKKIDLPESWVRGLVEVQAALSLAPVELTLSSSYLADILARLESEREKEGPRALVFNLTPGEKPEIEIQPWGEIYKVSDKIYTGEDNRKIKVWGRRRLRVLSNLLSIVPELKVRLIDSGMPSFWSIEIEGVVLTIGISGWTSQDWAGRARFSAITPASDLSPNIIENASTLLKKKNALSVDELANKINQSPGDSRRILQSLCIKGLAMFDPENGKYRWRALFPSLNLERQSQAGLEERKGLEIFKSNKIKIISDQITAKGRELKGLVESDEKVNQPSIIKDLDGRVINAQCDCSHFRFHKLRQGPCRHIVSLSLQGGG